MIAFIDKWFNAFGILLIAAIIAIANVAVRDDTYIRDAIDIRQAAQQPWGQK